MSLYGEEIIDRLSAGTGLRDADNPMRKLIDDGVGGWLDRFDDDGLAENVFLESAAGKWLDVHGRQFNVVRKPGELDDDYRSRIVYESLGHLTVPYLKDVYGVELYTGETFDVSRNVLVSDNAFVDGNYLMGLASEEVQMVLNRKFLLDNIVFWVIDGSIDFIIDVNGVNVLKDYMDIYNVIDGKRYFRYNDDLKSVRLYLVGLTSALQMFQYCEGLTSVDLDFPNLSSAERMFNNMSNVTSITLNTPKLSNFRGGVLGCTSLEYLNITCLPAYANQLKEDLQVWPIPNLETLIINNEVIPL